MLIATIVKTFFFLLAAWLFGTILAGAVPFEGAMLWHIYAYMLTAALIDVAQHVYKGPKQ